MSPERAPLFLARRTYRQRRLADAARMLPVAGAVLVCLPLLWRGGGWMATTAVMFYVFGLWLVLAVISGVLSHFLRPSDAEVAPPQREDR